MRDLLDVIDAAWDFEDPARSETRFRALLDEASGTDAEVLTTQLARAVGLQERYDEALGLLDRVAASGHPETRVRTLLERGRVLRSSGSPSAERFVEAAELARVQGLEALRVDALHMWALTAFEQALAARERIGRPRGTRIARWMVGWTLRLLDRTDEALAVQQALRAELDAAGETDPYVEEELQALRGSDPVSEA